MRQFIADRKAISRCFVFEELNSKFIESTAMRIETMIRRNMRVIRFIVSNNDLSNDYLNAITSMTSSLYDRDNTIAKDIQAFFNFKGYACIVECMDKQFHDRSDETSYSIVLTYEDHVSVEVNQADDDWPA